MLSEKAPPNKRIRPGAIIRVVHVGHPLGNQPTAGGRRCLLTAADPRTGAIRALVGGFDFSRNKFNHVTQAWRQPGSSFKPFIYSAAFEKGYGPEQCR